MLGNNTRELFSEAAPSVGQNSLDVAALAGVAAVSSLAALEQNLIQTNNFLDRGTPESNPLHEFRITPEARAIDKSAWAIVSASLSMAAEMSLSPREGGLGLRNVLVSDTALSDQCPLQISCSDPGSRFRTADGSCNNLRNPVFGKSNTPAQRILPPTYDDGLVSFRTRGVDGGILPSVRNISSSIMIDIDKPDPVFTLSVMQWAQFMDHDFAHIPFPSLENGEGIDCCSRHGGEELHPRCAPIDVSGDPFYAQFGRSCMNFVRSMLAIGPGEACTFGFAEQLNQLTHWIDGSTVYGNNEDEAKALKASKTGS
ncbi:Chorion peroxidase [Chionoecetes opilio]|uniref:Chorion peroxidase n=1 Tax=Chionoecetes opilio TaxID=41210 RepID=A0A8J5D4K6_CHIOP|nr:Chorion peroxidase [Chionoecetes opilio]